jgi:hypothetical protein
LYNFLICFPRLQQLDGEMNKALAELDRERSNAAASINEQVCF